MRNLFQSTAVNLMVLMVDSTDHITGVTGLTLSVQISKAGGAFAAVSPVVTERGFGWYAIALEASHTDTVGDLALHVTATGADPSDVLCVVGPSPSDIRMVNGTTVKGNGTVGNEWGPV